MSLGAAHGEALGVTRPRTYLVVLCKRLCFVGEHLQCCTWVLLIRGNEEFEHACNGLLIGVLDGRRYEHDMDRYAIRRTCISITKMIEENSEREAPRESRVILPGQSHISRGMTVLAY
jgi:hypothetical protein